MTNPIQFQTRAGDNFYRSVTWSSDGVPVDLTGCVLEFSIRGGSISWQFLNDSHIDLIDAEYGQFFIQLSPSETRALRSSGISSFSFEVTVQFSPLTRRTILYGNIVVSGEVVT